MVGGSSVETAPKPARRRRPFRPGRLFLILVPLHVAAFIALYFGTISIVQKEILATHTHDARVLMVEAINDLHPLMVSHDDIEAREKLARFIQAHALLDMKVFNPEGGMVGERGRSGSDPEVLEFLDLEQPEWFRFERDSDRLTLHGMLRLESEGDCQRCHAPDQLIGVASMHLDMTPQVKAAHDRMGRHLSILIVSWVLVVGTVNVVAGRMARRSLDKLEAGIGPDGRPSAVPAAGVGSLFLDPVSEQLYESLRRTLERQREREAEVTSRIHHTERLASLGQLAAGLAHEIKNPLAGIHGVLELLRDDEGDEARKKLYVEMIGELDRVNHTIHSLLSFARPAAPQRRPTQIGVLIDGVARLLRPGLAKKGIRLESSTAPDLPSFELDKDQIRQVLINLINNAAEAIEKDGSIAVRATAFPDGGGLIIAVEDDGPGIPEGSQETIFEPFHTTKFSGTGLGLSVVRSLVQQHGGRVELESTPGEGTTFYILLPAADDDDSANAIGPADGRRPGPEA